MFLIRVILLCLFPILLSSSALDQNTQCSEGIAPSWVKSHDFPIEALPIKSSHVNLQYLLIDTQKNWVEKTLYRHFAVKVLTQSGVEKISQLNIDFDPSYCQVIVHCIRVLREGVWLDRLKNSRRNVIQREKALEQNLYNGDLTLIYFLDDIRQDDVIEYSYSLLGHHPFFSSHYTDMLYLQRNFPVDKMTHRLLSPPNLSFQMKPVSITIEPKIIDLSPSLREWTWEVSETLPYEHESDEPIWHNPPAHIEMSQYKSWGEVAQKLFPLYRLPSDFFQTIPSEMQDLVEKWKRSTEDLSERAKLALRFVQDEVRYLGIEEGMGAFQPNDPRIIFQRRFGDCKDKTFLLHALFQLMDIPSCPTLVHSSKGKKLPEVLPMPILFNHLVLQLEIDGDTYWVDPTSSLQGGSLQTNFFPDYQWGLLLSNNTETLTPIPTVAFKKPTEIDTSFVLESEDSALLTIKSIFYDSQADRLRRSLEWRGLKKMSEESISDMQEVYGAVTLDSPMQVQDDRENNIFTLIESYRVPTHAFSDRKVMKLFSYTLRYYLYDRVNPERSSPYILPYPLWVKEHIHIENPFMKWEAFEEQYTQEHESLLYTLSTQIKTHGADFDLELKHLQDHIPQASLQDYWNIVNDIDRKALPRMTITLIPSQISVSSFLQVSCSTLGLLIWPLLYFFSRKKRAPQDVLSFCIKKSQKFHSIITALSTMCITESPAGASFTTLGICLIANVICHNVIMQRTIRLILVMQCFVGLQTCLLFYFISTDQDMQLALKVFTLTVCCFYFGYSMICLSKARVHLVQEKRAASLVS